MATFAEPRLNLPEWEPPIPDQQWSVYRTVLHELGDAGIPFSIGGGLALNAYTGLWRNTKDLDVYVTPENRAQAIEALTCAGLSDYYDVHPYERHWIYRGHIDDVIVDVIWAMANHRDFVDNDWISRGPTVSLRGEALRLLPAEEMLWAKLYVLQRERCDWGDTMNLVHALGEQLDWARLMTRIGDDAPLLDAMLRVYAWLCPDCAAKLPAWLYQIPARLQSG